MNENLSFNPDTLPSQAVTIVTPAVSTELTARPDFTELLVLLKNAKRGCWVFAIYNNLAAREEIVSAIKRTTQPLPVYEWTYTPAQPAPIAYLQYLTEAQQKTHSTVFFFDLERGGENAWKALDYYRETLSDHPHAIVIWVTQVGRIAAARKAPHFWAQRSMVFDFTITASDQHLELMGSWAGQDFSFENYDEAVRQLRIQQGLLDDYLELPDPPTQTVADLHRKVALTLNYLNRREEALPHLLELIALAEKIGDDNLKAEALTNLAQVERIHSGKPTAIALLEQARLLAQTPNLRASIAYNLGSALMTQGQPQKSQELLTEALRLYQQEGDKSGQANVLQAIGEVQSFRKEMDAALQSYEEALQLYQEVGDKLGQANVQKAIGGMQAFRGEREEALTSYDSALQLFHQVGDKLGQADVHLALGRINKSNNDFEKAILIYEQIGTGYSIARGKFFYAILLLEQDQSEQAKKLLIAAKTLWQNIDFLREVDMVDILLSELS